jgi:ABC-2 type transport system permease protein
MFAKTKAILNIEFQRQLTYRLNFFAYRFGSTIEIAAMLIIWTAVYRGAGSAVPGYSYEEMMTYVLVGWFFTCFTANYAFERIVSGQIMKGDVSMFLLKPMHYIQYILTFSIGRVSLALGSALLTQAVFATLFFPVLVLSFDPVRLFLIAAMLVVGYFLKLLFSFLLGFLAFWFTDVEGMMTFFNACRDFLSGGKFPLTLLSGIVGTSILYNPFAYTFFIPIQLFLGKISVREGLIGLAIEIGWLLFFALIVLVVWRKGLRKYEGVGI